MADERPSDDEVIRAYLNRLSAAPGQKAGPIPVKATPHKQAGLDVLVVRCPRCSHVAAFDGPGKGTCPGCAQVLEFGK